MDWQLVLGVFAAGCRPSNVYSSIGCVLFHDWLHVWFMLDLLCFFLFISDAISFSAVFVWCGFQTGNFVQVRCLIATVFSV